MIRNIIKRDGRTALYDREKITNAIYKAAEALGGKNHEMAAELAESVEEYLSQELGNTTPSVEEIQNAVERILMQSGHEATSKQYILYRAERTKIREMNTRLMQLYSDLASQSSTENDIKRENANIDGDTAMGTMLKFGSEGAKQFYKMSVLDPKHSEAHESGDIHIHDLDFLTLTTTCCQIDIDKLFEGGFSTGHGFIREPQDIQSYSALACIAIQSNQNDQHGGQSIPNFDYAMAKGVAKTYRKLYRRNLQKALDLYGIEESEAKALEIIKKIGEQYTLSPVLSADNGFHEKELPLLAEIVKNEETARDLQKFALKYAANETERATYQAMEALVHNLNTMHSRAGAQIPFSSINYGTDTSPEGRLVIRSVLGATNDGLGGGETAIFPIHIFKVKSGVNYEKSDPNYDLFQLACKVSAKRLFPNFSFLDAPFNAQFYKEGCPETEAAYMGCRTRVVANTYDPTRQTVNGRGNLSFTSVNLPRLAINAGKNVDVFFKMLDERISLIAEQLMDRYRLIADKTVRNFPFLMGQGIWLDSDKLSVDDKVGEILKHGTLSVGFIGLAECLVALTGQHHGESKASQELGLDIIGYMRAQTDRLSLETGFNYSLIATPAEGLSGRFVEIDREKYGKIAGVTDREYYTNSFHIPVYYDISAYDKIRIEAPYHELTNGGHITYVELDGDPCKNLEAFESIVRFMKESGVGYGSINHPVDRDSVCGFNGIIDNECPKCGRTEAQGANFERIRRITGYLVGTLDRFNNAKRAEVADRIKHPLTAKREVL